MPLAGPKFQIPSPKLPLPKGLHEHPMKLSYPSTSLQPGLLDSWATNQKTWTQTSDSLTPCVSSRVSPCPSETQFPNL